MQTLWQDLRYGARTLLKNPVFTLIAVITLSLGIGANTAIFSVVDAVLLRPMPYPEAHRLVVLWSTGSRGTSAFGSAMPDYREWRDQNRTLEGLAGFYYGDFNLSPAGGEPERVQGAYITSNLFNVLKVSPALGRLFTPEEDQFGRHRVVLLSHGLWQRSFGGDHAIVGREIKLGGESVTVAGVMPRGLPFFDNVPEVELWTPIAFAPGDSMDTRNNHFVILVGRLKPGLTVAQAQEDASAVARRMEEQFPENKGLGALIRPAHEQLTGDSSAALYVLLGAVAFVLLVACVNVANLMLARAAARGREMAIRTSLGASRARIVRQLTVECLPLGLVGGALGVLLALWGIDLLGSFLPASLPRHNAIAVNGRVLVFTLALALFTSLLFGLAPALQASKVDLIPTLKDEAGLGGYRSSRFRNGLVVAQVALSLLLLIAAGLIVRSLQQTQMIGPGFEVENRVTMSVDLGLQGYDEARGREFYKQLITRVESMPGVRGASYIDSLLLNLDFNGGSFYIEGQPFTRSSDLPTVPYGLVWPRYFETMGIPLLEGRDFTMRDDKDESRVAIVNENFARRFWPGQNPIGKRLSRGGPEAPRFEVVGVVKDGKYWTLGENPRPFVYFPMTREYDSNVSLVVHTGVDPQSMINAVRREVERLDANLPLYDVKTMGEHLRFPLLPLRVGAWVAGSFALLTLLLTGLGLYGVMAYAVSQRTREIGIRMALGARSRDVMRLVVRQGMWLALSGLAIGLAGALVLTRLMSSVLYGVSATDAVTFAGVTLLLGSVALLACYLPARRAAMVDSIIALRCE